MISIHVTLPGCEKRGSAIIVVLMVCLVLGIMVGAILNFQRGQAHLLSKSAKDYLALCAADAGLNCVLAEMRANPQFVTHGSIYIPLKGWTSPAKHRPFVVGETRGLELDHNGNGTYGGRVVLEKTRIIGDFRVRVRLLSAKNSLDTKTVDEAHRYFLLEAVGRVDDSHRKVTAILERFTPTSFLLYDGGILDTGAYGPYRLTPGVLRRGRLYGHEGLKIARRGMIDQGSDLLDMEKISTPGYLEIRQSTRLSFRNGQEGRLDSGNSSSKMDKFKTFPEERGGRVIGHFVLDGMRGAKSERLPPLNPNYWKEATRPKPTMLGPGSSFRGFSASKWRNPAKPQEAVYDLFFGWEYESKKEDMLLYSTVPLRIWGCPPWKALTIFCEKDVYIAGDFNQHPDFPQNYELGYKDYTSQPENGSEKNGCMILSQGRIWFDYSHPIQYLRNELVNLIDYEIAMRLGGKDLNPAALAAICYPPRFSTNSDPRQPMLALHFKGIASLFALPKEPPQVIPVTLAGLVMHSALKELREFLEPGKNAAESATRFGIKSLICREKVLAKIGAACYMTGFLTKGERNSVINDLLDQAEKEDRDEPNPNLGPWNVADRLFRLAVTHPKMGFRFPEMTVNALLVDSAELNARWDQGDHLDKVLPEIGNITSKEAICFPFVGSDTRMLLRHLGGRVHLRTQPSDVFLDGSAREDFFLVRRNQYDHSLVAGGGDYYPSYVPAGFAVINWQDDSCTREEFDSF
ncbi:MAG TPA: hypothetical protein PKO06_02890 [Candidatus Ozemobacteraceae bacterium]|nr:hypothetical protein [Candidatus Ozemobacteraceae bacterium]